MKRALVTVVLLVLSLAAASLTAQAGTVKVGVITPTTGSMASIGNAVLDGIKLAVKLINEKGINGNKLELVIYDDRNIPDEAVSAAKRLISGDKVPVIIGSVGSSPTAAVQQITMKAQIPTITPVSMAPKLTELGDKYFFRATATAAMREVVFAKFVSQRLRAKTVAFLAANDDLGRSTVEAAVKEYGRYATPKVVSTAYFEPGSTDFSAELAKIRALNPDVIYLVADSTRASIIVKQLRALKVSSIVVASAEAATNEFIRLAGPASEGIYFPLDWAVTFDDEASLEFLSQYKKEYGKLPETKFAVQGWETAWVVAEAVRLAGKDLTPSGIREGLTKVKWTGPRGVFDFDEKGQVKIESRIAIIKDGKFVVAK